ncbi:MAG TPA: FkbM family methyltransferase [Gemmatimonadaceae bacterium]|nr:FkbM family methyltransferase [Gemmatimonadaceae bacterium]
MLTKARSSAILAAKRVLWKAMRVPVLFKLARLVAEEGAQFAHFAAVAEVGKELDSALGSTVRRGPFAGMTYPSRVTVGSTLYPKLLGSYERELQPCIDQAVARSYRTIVDIGAAEGYYAIGLARAIPGTRVFAFEANPAGAGALQAMAQANNVADRVNVLGTATIENLGALPVERPVLVVCDCEGCEHRLLDPVRVSWLRDADVIVEVHQLHGTNPRAELRERFEKTHEVSIVEVRRRDSSLYPELDRLDPSHREAILFERTDLNGWMWLRAKASTGAERPPDGLHQSPPR